MAFKKADNDVDDGDDFGDDDVDVDDGFQKQNTNLLTKNMTFA